MYRNHKDKKYDELPYDCLILQNPFYEERGEKPIIKLVTVDVKPLIDTTIDYVLSNVEKYIDEDDYRYDSAIRGVFDKLSGEDTGYTYEELKQVYEFFRKSLKLDENVQPVEGHTKEECIREILEFFIYKAYDEEGYKEHCWSFETYVEEYTSEQMGSIHSYVANRIYDEGYDIYREVLDDIHADEIFYRTHTGY